MKKLYIIFIIIAFNTGVIHSQPLHIDWQNCFGGDYYDQVYDVLFLGDSYIFVGSYELPCSNCGFEQFQDDVWLIKTDLYGNQLWEKWLGGSSGDSGYKLISSIDGNIWIIAASVSSDGDIQNDPYPNSSNQWIVKIDSNGNILSENIYGGNCKDLCYDGLTTDTGLVTIGYTCSFDGEVSEHYGFYDCWVLNINGQGEKIWDFSFGSTSAERGKCIAKTNDNGYLCGSSYYPNTNNGNFQCVPYGDYGGFSIFKLDSLGQMLWYTCYGSSGGTGINTIVAVEDGYLLGCYGFGTDGDMTGSGYHYGWDQSMQSEDIWLIKVDFDGNIMWQKCYGGSRNEFVNKIFNTEDGGYMVFGSTRSNDGDVSGNHENTEYLEDIWVFKIDGNGVLQWQQCIGGGAPEILHSGVYKISESEYVVACDFSYGPSGDVECVHQQNQDIWVLKLTDTTVGLESNIASKDALSVYPNPANTYVVFEQTAKLQGTINIYNAYGQQLTSLPTNELKTVWDTRTIQAGVYFYTFEASNTVQAGKITIVK